MPNFNIFYFTPKGPEKILLFSKIDPNGDPSELEIKPKLIFQVIAVRNLNIIWEIGKKGKTRHPGWQL